MGAYTVKEVTEMASNVTRLAEPQYASLRNDPFGSGREFGCNVMGYQLHATLPAWFSATRRQGRLATRIL